MKKTMIAFALTSVLASPAQAGFWDFLFSDSKEDQQETSIVDTVKETTKQAVINKVMNTEENTQETTQASSAVANTLQAASGLLPMLTSQLNISNEQAQGGMGAILQTVKGNLSGDDFGKLSQSIPNMDSLLSAAPKIEGDDMTSKVTGMLANAGGIGSKLSSAAQLASQFKSLNMDAGMISKFATVAMGFLGNSGNGSADLLKQGLGSILGQGGE